MESDPIYLLIDAGNTRVKWGAREGERWLATGAVATVDSARIAEQWANVPAATRFALICNVAGDLVEGHLEAACAARGIRVKRFASTAGQLGVRNGYNEPSQLGSDRWAALLAAHHRVPGHKLVVNAGTALTVDALDGGGQFLGGLIVPGPALMRRSLDRGTARLRQTEGAFQDFPRQTADAITTGALQACAGAVQRMAEAMKAAGSKPGVVVLSGGAANELAPHLPLQVAIHENLVLEGLALAARDS